MMKEPLVFKNKVISPANIIAGFIYNEETKEIDFIFNQTSEYKFNSMEDFKELMVNTLLALDEKSFEK